MTAGESAADRARRMREKAQRLERAAEKWERGAEGERRIAAILDQLPPEYVVFHDVRLPASKANVDHLVVSSGGIWAIDTKNYSSPVTHGSGKGAGKLWVGKWPIDDRLETAAWEASVVAELIGRHVAPLVCVIAPSVPSPAFDFKGVRICTPASVVEELTRSFEPVDVPSAVFALEHALGATAATRSGNAWEAPVGRAAPVAGKRPARPRTPNTPPARPGTEGISRVVLRLLVGLLGLAVLTAALQSGIVTDLITGIVTQPAQRMADQARQRAEESLAQNTTIDVTSTSSVIALLEDPEPIAYTASCAPGGTSWILNWVWPGDVPAGVAGYGVASQRIDGPKVSHTIGAWRSPEEGRPADLRVMADSADFVVITEYRSGDGTVLAETHEPFRRPSLVC